MTTALKVEYLVIVDTKNSFCSNEAAFNNLLKANSDIDIRNRKLKHKKLEVDYEVQTDQLKDKNERFFHVRFSCADYERTSEFEQLLKAVRDLLHKASIRHPQTLWDDVSFFYSSKAYPFIYQIENLMRKLITKFMLTNVGLEWTKDSVPEEVKNSVRMDKKEESPDYLYQTDFIQLANFLFKEYSPFPPSTLIDKISKIEKVEDLSLDDLTKYVPRSNWDRYFSKIVDCDHTFLKNRWETLYKLRCKIAHNNSITKFEYDQIEKLYDELKDKLNKAIDSLDKIVISAEEKDIVAENVISSKNDLFFKFVSHYKKLEFALARTAISQNLYSEHDFLKKRFNVAYLTKTLVEKKVIDENLGNEIDNLSKLRNYIVHSSTVLLNQDQINILTAALVNIIYKLESITDIEHLEMQQGLSEEDLTKNEIIEQENNIN
ncbi:hypothetical protein FE783_09760 [Paenibacillus mesophilus]|uniref:HEPN domain-containing protein n=1 Tax=Paenibacillus mesophilus TaxID=2582849 RepID=UPI00110E2EAB|nr:HEPN domain-containing protein [Paenibacillus mesophilus]TMV50935.1 hypothetical protein FE783_09760 [Paenibacillus mesophilus]